jgi:methionyl-tRNA formyltransferase
MNISVLCSDKEHPVYQRLVHWCSSKESSHNVELVQRKKQLSGGKILFLISCHEIIGPDIRLKYDHSLVIHASDLPRGRGWSPLVWQVLEGKNEIVVSLLEAEEQVDTGRIWCQKKIYFEGHELADEMNQALFDAEIDLMNFAVDNKSTVEPVDQSEEQATYYRKRTPDDSKIDPDKNIVSQFDLLRVADPVRYPAFFDYRGHKYKISISKMDVK